MCKTYLIFSAQYLPTAGGVERYSNCLARKLREKGHRVIIVTSSLKDLPAQETDPDGIEILRFPSLPFMNGRLPLLYPGKHFGPLSKWLWQQHIDCCVINTYFYPLSMYAACLTHRKHIPTILINHGSAWLMTGNPILSFAGRCYERIAAAFCHHHCDRFFGVSEAACNWLHTFSIQANGIITNAIDPMDIYQQIPSGFDWRTALDLPEDSRIISFVGRMIPEKGVEPLICAMETIRRQYPNTYLLMAGSGPLLEKYKAAPPEGVCLLGVQPYPRVLALMQQSDLFCLPSRSEGFACTVLEAAALGCPIITTATGGSPQLLITPDHGTLLPDMESSSISSACTAALGDAQWRRNASHLSKERLLSNYTWEVAVQQLLNAFDASSYV